MSEQPKNCGDCRYYQPLEAQGGQCHRFPPVFAGDTIRSTVTIGRKAEDPKRPRHGQVVEIVETRNQRGETVMYCEHILLAERRQPADPA